VITVQPQHISFLKVMFLWLLIAVLLSLTAPEFAAATTP
jgi:hypothetical protein